jgi:hypothetical protein
MTDEDEMGPRTAHAHRAFTAHFGRAPSDDGYDERWIWGYVAALEDLPDEALASLELS